MFEVIFETDSGKRYVFGKNGNTYFGMDVGNGMEIQLGTAQGFLQIGETVETQRVGGRPINVTGEVFGNIVERKNALRNVCAPFTSGRLIFQEKYFIRVYVKAAPTFSAVKNNGLFTMQFFAPFPFFRTMDEKVAYIGVITPQFRFPVNYANTHRFGTKSAARYTNIINEGDVKIPFGVYLHSSGECTNITISNLKTLAYLKLNGTLSAGESMKIYRDDDGVLRAELTTGGGVTDAISWIDEGSTLFELEVGDNLVAATDDNNGASLTASFTFREAVGSVYES